ncbi:MAG: tetratricopeptide repeat protein [Pirellulales bacterium]|nr:tetratricopeptide repeat protein [Pirellulales bacterium]
MLDKPPNKHDPGSRLATPAVCAALVLAVAAVFGQTVGFEFVNLDDDACVSQNQALMNGLSWQSVGWAFTNNLVGNWDPLTWLSHLLDWELYGDRAGGHHLTNVLLHAAATVLLFLVLRNMTGRFWPSAIAAAIFALHPLRAESVAWVTERKDVLSGVFFMLTLAAYAGYVRRRFSPWRYALVIMAFALGLMSKPMLVTLPFVLLLLDYWPLKRPALEKRRPTATVLRLVVEKVPLFALTAACCVATVRAQHVPDYQHGPWSWRIGNAAISYVDYLGRFFYPVGLSPLTPRTDFDLPLWRVAASAVVLAAITAAVFLWVRKRPYLPVGWLWFVGMLFPVIGLVPFGTQAMADRFTYLPQIGLCIALVWGADELTRRWPYRRWICGIISATAICALAICAWRQTGFWRESETIWRRTIACTSDNYMARYALGNVLAGQGRLVEAAAEYRKAREIMPREPAAEYNLGVAAGSRRRWNEAITHYLRALAANPLHTNARNNLANAYLNVGEVYEAIKQSRTVLRIDPKFSEARINIGHAMLVLKRYEEAAEEYRRALAGGVEYPEARYNLAIALYFLGRRDEAAEHYRRAVRTQPKILEGRMDLGELLEKKK